jgi:hypothetical protein
MNGTGVWMVQQTFLPAKEDMQRITTIKMVISVDDIDLASTLDNEQ